MCGRFTLRTPPVDLVELFDLLREPMWVPRFNIAPSQSVLAIRSDQGGRKSGLLTWGLVPSWVKDPKIGSRMINACAETVATLPSFRAAFKRRRCLIAADGFYEWQKTGGKTKQPYFIGLEDDRPFAFAGLWAHWVDTDGSTIFSCTIITTTANSLREEIHERLPVLLAPDDYDCWLDPKIEGGDELEALLVPCDANAMRRYPVSTFVNNPRHDGPECVEPAADQGTLFEE